MRNYSVLMSVYYKEKAEFLQQSIESMLAQTFVTDDFVIVCDGQLTSELNQTITKFENENPDIFNVIRLEENQGQGYALNVGLKKCKNDLIARMDSDDISLLDRCEKQLQIFKNNENIDIVSGSVIEFETQINDNTICKTLPENHKDIIKFTKKRNPFNHPSVMFKKEAVLKAGSYQDFYLYEDYFLWVRMLNTGAIGYNIKDPLVYMRAGADMYKRRGGYRYFRSSLKFQKFLLKNKTINIVTYYKNIIIRFFAQVLISNALREIIYKKIIRKT